LKLKTHHDLVYRKFAQVCTELKLLYVAITRPKNFLLIYDDDTHSRKSIQDYWVQTKVVDHIDKKMMLDFDLIPEHIKSALRMLDTPDLDPSKNDKVTSEKVK
jgi:ATP-dependent exoDNAse (exonuclease V) beta subunit